LSGAIPVGIYVSISGNQCQVKIIFLRKNFGLPIITVIFYENGVSGHVQAQKSDGGTKARQKKVRQIRRFRR